MCRHRRQPLRGTVVLIAANDDKPLDLFPECSAEDRAVQVGVDELYETDSTPGWTHRNAALVCVFCSGLKLA